MRIISDHLQGRKTNLSDSMAAELDWAQIYRYAQIHQLEGILFHQLQAFFAGKKEYISIASQLEKSKAACIYYYALNSHAIDEIQNTFQVYNIRFFPVKGLEIASCYPIPMYRTMGDLDIVVFPKEKVKASKTLEKLGYTLLEKNFGLQFRKQSINLELDTHLLHKETLENNKRRRYFDTCWKYLIVDSDGKYHLDINFHYVYLVEHIKKHFRTRGIGFRQFIDLAVFAQKHSELDWEWIKIQLQKIDLWKFAVLAHTYIYIWWGMESPFSIEKLEQNFYEETTDYVFSSGVFGFENKNQSLYVAEAYLNSDRRTGFFTHFIYIMRNTFIPYSKMITLPYCSFIAGKKWLLPYGWIYRVYYKLKRKGCSGKNKVSIESKEIMDNHRNLMKKWNI